MITYCVGPDCLRKWTGRCWLFRPRWNCRQRKPFPNSVAKLQNLGNPICTVQQYIKLMLITRHGGLRIYRTWAMAFGCSTRLGLSEMVSAQVVPELMALGDCQYVLLIVTRPPQLLTTSASSGLLNWNELRYKNEEELLMQQTLANELEQEPLGRPLEPEQRKLGAQTPLMPLGSVQLWYKMLFILNQFAAFVHDDDDDNGNGKYPTPLPVATAAAPLTLAIVDG